MGDCPPNTDLINNANSQAAIRKSFAFCGWAMMCAAMGFVMIGDQWENGIGLILSESDSGFGVSTQKLAQLRFCCMGAVLSGIFAFGHLLHSAILFVREKDCEHGLPVGMVFQASSSGPVGKDLPSCS